MTIFVSIASYRDPELLPTIKDSLTRARYPDQLRFGVCWQHKSGDAPLAISENPHIRVLDVDWLDSQGTCWARAEVMRLYHGEDHFLQIDSHHRFIQDWDSKLVDYVESAPSEKPIITTYCPPYSPGEPLSRLNEPTQMAFDHFTADGIPMFRPAVLENWKQLGRLQRSRFISAHFLFTLGSFVEEVPYDPGLYFHGEEITLAVRAYTWGYDFFHPPEVLLWHEYSREYRPKHWDDHIESAGVEVAWQERDRISKQRVRQLLLDPIVGEYACGPERTLAQYEAYAGINFCHRKVQGYTLRGAEPPNPVTDNDWYESAGPDSDSPSGQQLTIGSSFDNSGPLTDRVLNLVDGVFCLVDDAQECDRHFHPPGIAERMSPIIPTQVAEPEQRRLTVWRHALSEAARRGYKHVLLWEDPSGPSDTSVAVDLSTWCKQEWDLYLWSANSDGDAARGSATPLAPYSLAIVVHHRAYDRILSEIPASPPEMARFLARWGNLESYLLQGVPHDAIQGAGVAFVCRPHAIQRPDVHRVNVGRPLLASGIEVIERDEGLMVRRKGTPEIHHLNNTASIVLALCDGQRTVPEIAKVFAKNFTLRTIPVPEVSACVDMLQHAGLLTDSENLSKKEDIAAIDHDTHSAESGKA